MRTAAAGFRTLPHAMERGFRARSLTAALDQLKAEAGERPIGLVLGSGFEDDPDLIARLGGRYELLGCGAEVVRRVKEPGSFIPMLDQLGIAHPETQIEPPAAGEGWLTKRVGGSGGLHIAKCRARVSGLPRRYFQKQMSGAPTSVSGVVSPSCIKLSITRQWTAPMPRRPCRFGGAVWPCDPGPEAVEVMLAAALLVSRQAGVAGLCSFDFLLTDDGPVLLEVNPRPVATLDILDDAAGSLFQAHVNQFAKTGASDGDTSLSDGAGARAVAYLYADDGPLTVGEVDWPEWTADRPLPGTLVERWRPIATVLADAASPDLAQELCRERLGLLARVVYGRKIREEPCR